MNTKFPCWIREHHDRLGCEGVLDASYRFPVYLVFPVRHAIAFDRNQVM